jgi:transposase
VETDPTRVCEILVGLPDVDVLGVDEPGGAQAPLTVHVRVGADSVDCPGCGRRGWVKQHRVVVLTDLPVFGRPVRLAWHKTRRACPQPTCPTGSWTAHDDRIAARRCTITHRAARWATSQVGQAKRAVSAVAAELGCDWHTVNDAVLAYGEQLVDHPDRIGTVEAIGLDETLFTRTGQFRTRRWATTIADVSGHRLIDVVAGRDAGSVVDWLADRPQAWLDTIRVGTLDMAATYRSVYRQVLPQATLVADPFHVVRLATTCLDQVRRWVQNDLLGHRGHKTDPLYRARRLLTKAAERLDEPGTARLRGLLAAGDPDGHVTAAWQAKEAVRGHYHIPDPATAGDYLDALSADLRTPGRHRHLQRLGRTLHTWRSEILAWHTTGVSNGPTEGQNNLIKAIKRIGYGFRSFHNYRTRLLLAHGGVDWTLLPTLTPP